MSSELEKIDIIRARTGVSYSEARQALDEAGGDVVQALIRLEEGNKHFCKSMHGVSEEAVKRVKSLWKRGQKTRIKVKKDERTVFEVPATVGVLGLLGAAVSSELALLGVIGGAAAMTKNYKLEIDRGEQENEKSTETYFGPGNME